MTRQDLDDLNPSRDATRSVERCVEKLLLAAVGLCVALLVSGVILAILDGGGIPHAVVSPQFLPAGLVDGDSAAYLSLGLLVLLATPVLRVTGALVVFALERDRRYVLVTAAVLLVMGISVLLGTI